MKRLRDVLASLFVEKAEDEKKPPDDQKPPEPEKEKPLVSDEDRVQIARAIGAMFEAKKTSMKAEVHGMTCKVTLRVWDPPPGQTKYTVPVVFVEDIAVHTLRQWME